MTPPPGLLSAGLLPLALLPPGLPLPGEAAVWLRAVSPRRSRGRGAGGGNTWRDGMKSDDDSTDADNTNNTNGRRAGR